LAFEMQHYSLFIYFCLILKASVYIFSMLKTRWSEYQVCILHTGKILQEL